MEKICRFISEWMGILVLICAIVSFLCPVITDSISTNWINPLLGFVMFGMGLTLKPEDFKVVFSHPKDIVVGSIAQYTLMPLIAFGLSKALNLPTDLAIGVILVGCCPGGTASNVITYLAKGDIALSVGMTGVSTLLAPILTPLIVLALAGKSINVETAKMFISILQVVVAPILLGFIINHFFPSFTKKATNYLPAFSSITIALIVTIIIGKNSDKLSESGMVTIMVVILHNLLGLLTGFSLGKLLKLNHKKCTAISVEVGMQNSGLASSLANIHFAAYPMATIPGALFSVWHNLSGALVAKLYSSMKDKEFAQEQEKV
ncbi:MAG: bile acid:sodium symporter family protein [Paludibacteraceae bacterium]|nr:bile acid:sodium symporter family protein [Paludibacteraceae bacterium]